MAPDLYYNHERLRRAVVLLLGYRWGESRSKKLRQKIEAMPDRRPTRFQKPIEELNEFLLLAHQSKAKALELLDLIDLRRPKVLREVGLVTPERENRRTKWAESKAAYRNRLEMAVKVHELETDTTLSPEEAKEYQKAVVAEWNERRAKYVRSATGLSTAEAHSVFSRMLEEEVNERYQEAMRARERRRLSDPSMRRLKEHKNSQKTGASEEALAKLTRKFGGT